MNFKFCIYLLALQEYVSSSVQPNVTVLPASIKLRIGENFKSVCYFPGVTTLDLVNSLELEWYRNDTAISFMSSIKPDFSDRRYSVTLNSIKGKPNNLSSTLVIKDLKVSDSGKYVCKVGQKKAAVSLSVIATSKQPNVFVYPRSALLELGDTLTVKCNFPGVSTLDMVSFYPVKWLKDGQQISFLSSMDENLGDDRIGVAIDVHQANNLSSVLTVKNLTYSDEGKYTCKVKDRNDSTSLTINRETLQSSEGDMQILIVNDEKSKDDLTTRKSERPLYLRFSEGESVRLHCRIFETAIPRNAEWYKDGQLVTNMVTLSEVFKRSNIKVSMESGQSNEIVYDLQIKNVTLWDAGMYVCKVNEITRVLYVSVVKRCRYILKQALLIKDIYEIKDLYIHFFVLPSEF